MRVDLNTLNTSSHVAASATPPPPHPAITTSRAAATGGVVGDLSEGLECLEHRERLLRTKDKNN